MKTPKSGEIGAVRIWRNCGAPISPNHIFTLSPGGSDAVAAGEGGGSFGVCLLPQLRGPVTDWLPLPSLRLDPPGGRVKSKLVLVASPATAKKQGSSAQCPIPWNCQQRYRPMDGCIYLGFFSGKTTFAAWTTGLAQRPG